MAIRQSSQLSDQTKQRIIALVKAGDMTHAEIEHAFGLGQDRVRRVLEEAGEKKRGPRQESRRTAQAKVNPNRSTRWINRSLPVVDANTPMQSCARLSARLSVAACAERSTLADRGDQEQLYGACRNCAVGQSNRLGSGA